MRLVGRSSELVECGAVLDRTEEALVVHGEAGVGKTALVSAALEGIDHRAGGALGTLTWWSYLPLRRALPALPDETWTGDTDYVVEQVVAAIGRTVLLLEDLHWADPSTLSVVEQLVGQVRLVVTVRRGAPDAADVLSRLEGAGAVRLDLEPLPPDQAEVLARELRPGLVATEVTSLVSRSGGNPLLLEELTRDGDEAPSLRLALFARCRQLPEHLLDDMALLALAGHPLPEQAVEADGLVDSGLAVLDGSGMVSIRHALVGEVIGELLSPDRRARCRRTLVDLVEHPGEQARHLLALGDLASAHAAALEAVALAATPGERWQHLVTAAESAEDDEGAVLLVRAAEAALLAVQPEVAAALLARLPEGREVDRIAARARIELAYSRDDPAAWRSELDRGRRAADRDSVGAYQLACEEAIYVYNVEDDPERAFEILAGARALAERQGYPTCHVDATAGPIAYFLGRPGWESMLTRAVEEARALGDLDLEMSALRNLATSLASDGALDKAWDVMDRAVERCRDLRLQGYAQAIETARLKSWFHAGASDAVLTGAAELLARPLRASDRTIARWYAGMVRAFGGDSTAALAEAAELAHDSPGMAALLTVVAHAESGRPRATADAVDDLTSSGLSSLWLAYAAPFVAWSGRELGRTIELPLPAFVERGSLAGVRSELAGVDLLVAGDADGAALRFADAISAYGAVNRWATLRCRWGRGEALRLGGDPHAGDVLSAVHREARECGYLALAGRCERSLRAAGLETVPATATRGSRLSPREWEVSTLAAEGLTDAEIAARLGIAHRTVQAHVASARRKVGAATRTQLAAIHEDEPADASPPPR